VNGIGWRRWVTAGVGGVFCSFTVALLTKYQRGARKGDAVLLLFTLKKLECSKQGNVRSGDAATRTSWTALLLTF
jgi:hypothetical protein